MERPGSRHGSHKKTSPPGDVAAYVAPGSPRGRTRDQLYEEARSMGIKGRSTMNKEQLERAVARKRS